MRSEQLPLVLCSHSSEWYNVFPKTIAVGDKTEEEKKSKTESVSFRIERSVLDELRNESTQKVESLNVLVNQIFRNQ